MREFSVDFCSIVDAIEGRYATMIVTSKGFSGVLNTTISEIVEEEFDIRITVGETGETNRGEFWIDNASYYIDGDKVIIHGDKAEVAISLPEELVGTLEDDQPENTLSKCEGGVHLTTPIQQMEMSVVGYFVRLKSGNTLKIAIS